MYVITASAQAAARTRWRPDAGRRASATRGGSTWVLLMLGLRRDQDDHRPRLGAVRVEDRDDRPFVQPEGIVGGGKRGVDGSMPGAAGRRGGDLEFQGLPVGIQGDVEIPVHDAGSVAAAA